MAGRKKARFLQVKGWWDFQHYPDKVAHGYAPTWIKTYTALLDDYDYNALSELDRGRLHRIWLLAGKLNNKIPWDDRYVRVAIRAGNTFTLRTFVVTGMLLEWSEDAAVKPPKKAKKQPVQAGNALDDVYTNSMPEQSRAEQRRERQKPLDHLGVPGWENLPIDIEKERELTLIRESLRGTDDATMAALRKAAAGAAFGRCRKVRESIQSKPSRTVGVGYAINALRSEAEAA